MLETWISASILNVQLRRRQSSVYANLRAVERSFDFSRGVSRISVRGDGDSDDDDDEIDGIAGSRRQKFKGDFSKRRRAHAAACIRADAREDSHRLCARLTTTSTTTTAMVVYAGAYK